MNVSLITSLYSDSLRKGKFQYFYMFWWFKLTNVFAKAPPLAAATWLQWLRRNPSGRLQLSTLRPSVWFWRRLAAEVVIHYRNTSLARAEVSREMTVETWAGNRTLDFGATASKNLFSSNGRWFDHFWRFWWGNERLIEPDFRARLLLERLPAEAINWTFTLQNMQM